MMALIGMAVHSTVQNNRTWMTRKTLESLAETVDWSRHRLFVVDNASCDDAKRLFEEAKNWLPFTLITNEKNEGTSRAVNKGWMNRNKGENCLKLDDDCVFSESGWLDTLEACIEREPSIGIIGLKRDDLGQSPHEPKSSVLHSELVMLPHKPGQRWLVVEVVREALGTCILFGSALLDKIGYLYAPSVYSYDDCIAAVRCEVAGFVSAFWPHTEIAHIDPGGDAFCKWKTEEADRVTPRFDQLCAEYRSGSRSIYHAADE